MLIHTIKSFYVNGMFLYWYVFFRTNTCEFQMILNKTQTTDIFYSEALNPECIMFRFILLFFLYLMLFHLLSLLLSQLNRKY
jgi:hypothetical protein